MNILRKTPRPNGAFSCQKNAPFVPDDWAEISDELYAQHAANKCFSTPTFDGDIVVSLEDNPDARAAQEAADAAIVSDPSPEERIAELEAENSLFEAQIQATNTMLDFYEECMVEMVMIVYA